MMIVVVIPIHADQTLVLVDQKKSALEGLIPVLRGNADVVRMVNVQKINFVFVENVKVCDLEYSIQHKS